MLLGGNILRYDAESIDAKYDYSEEYYDEENAVIYNRYFLIDYENVNRNGLNGITKLTEEDCVKIYYSNTAETLTFGLHRRINASRAHFDYIKVQVPIKNAVDCQILFDIKNMIKDARESEYYIVSKDSDFDQAIDEFKTKRYKVKKVEEICKLSENYNMTTIPLSSKKKNSVTSDKAKREAKIRSFYGQYFKKKEYVDKKEEIIQLLLKAKTRQEINNGLQKMFSNETVGSMLKKMKPLIQDLPGR